MMVKTYHSFCVSRLSLVFISFFLSLTGLFSQVENCTNGIDDDGDGLIDCFDPDCTCTSPCADFYYTDCNANCSYVPPCGNLALGIQWTATVETNTYSPLVAGDMDHDGIPEVVTYLCEGPDLYILDGATGATKVHIVAPTSFAGGTAPAIADLFHDGFGEIVIVGNDRLLRCYGHDGTLIYTSAIQVGYDQRYRFSIPAIADFDHDGWAEINIGNQVFNGQTGALLAEGGPLVSAGEHPTRVANGFSFCSTVAIDALPDSFCPDCKGLEIVAGNQVLSVNLVTGVVAPVVTAPAGFSDGYTSVADIDDDGILDAVVQGKKGINNTVYAWNLQTGAVIRQYQLLNNWQEGASRINIADLDGDGKVDVCFLSFPWLYALKNDFTLLWKNQAFDASAVTCSSVFDFCGNGTSNVIYRGQQALQILDGPTGAVAWQDVCASATQIETPLILDVDNDGQTEIVIECGNNGDPNHGTVVAYEAVGTPGIASRKVWNQHGYFSTNINDDLSVPRYQQNPNLVGNHVKMNTFMNQYFNPSFPSPNGTVTVQKVQCFGDSLELSLQICNKGSNVLPFLTPLSVYQKNPLYNPAQWLKTTKTGFTLKPDSCQNMTFRILRPVNNDSVFVVLNDNHSHATPFSLTQNFPVTTIGECNFKDNIAGLAFPYSPKMVNLGADTSLCDHTALTVHADGSNLIKWHWQDGKTDSIRALTIPGTYSVTVTDNCGFTQTDHIKISIDSSTVVSIGPNQSICSGGAVTLSESGFDFYKWTPAGVVNCPTCPTVMATLPSTGIVILEAGFNNGCVNKDTVLITVKDTFNFNIDTSICYGRTVLWNGVQIKPDSSHIFKLHTAFGCDSTVHVRVHGSLIGTFTTHVDTAVCLGKTLPFDGFILQPGDSKTYFLSAATGCDSTVLVKVIPKDTFYTKETLIRCFGDTASVFGNPQWASGVFLKKFIAKNGCDSTHLVTLNVLDPILLSFKEMPACYHETNGSLAVTVDGQAPPFNYAWNLPGQHAPVLQEVPAGNYSVTVTDHNDCTETGSSAVSAYPPIVYTAKADSVLCYGQSNGAINITSPDTTLTYSLDGDAYKQQLKWPGLPASNYHVFAQDVYGCIDTLPLKVGQPIALVLDLPGDTSVALGETVLLHTVLLGGTLPLQYSWQDTSYLSCKACPNPVSTPLDNILYALTITDANGCSATDQLYIKVGRVIGLYAPNIFNPEGNPINSRFDLGCGPAIIRINYIRIFDRWGNLVFENKNGTPNDLSQGWDGRFKGKPVQSGVYVWVAELALIDGTTVIQKGNVTVIR
jgi:gliding motility-associated-like protein